MGSPHHEQGAVVPSCTQWLRGRSASANVPLGSLNSTIIFHTSPVGPHAVVLHKVARSATAGGSGLPGTLKSTLAVQKSRSRSAFTIQLSSLPLGVIVIVDPENSTSFLSPSAMSAKTAWCVVQRMPRVLTQLRAGEVPGGPPLEFEPCAAAAVDFC